MKAWICLTVAYLCVSSSSAAETCGALKEDLETACEYPSNIILISSPNKKKVDSDNCDSEYEKAEWQEEPTVVFPEAKPNKSYTLLGIDPDPPAYQKGQYFLHWLVSNIRGEDFVKGDLSKAKCTQSYYGPSPPEGSGVHRYLFLVFEENDNDREIEDPGRRSRFELVPWLRRQTKLCGPVAGIQFRTKF